MDRPLGIGTVVVLERADRTDGPVSGPRAGGTQDEALRVLERMRTSATDEREQDAIMDVMDVASGFISPTLRVWP